MNQRWKIRNRIRIGTETQQAHRHHLVPVVVVLTDQHLDPDRDGALVIGLGQGQREQELVPRDRECVGGNGDDAGDRDGHQKSPDGHHGAAAVDPHRFVQLPGDGVEVAGHHQDRVRKGEDQVGQDQALVGVAETGSHHQTEVRDDQRDRRNGLGADDRDRQRLLQPEVVPTQCVRGLDGDHHRQDGDCERDEVAVDEESDLGRIVEHVSVGGEGEAGRDDLRRVGEDLGVGLERADQHPEHGKHHEHRADQEPGDQPCSHQLPAGSRAGSVAPSRRCHHCRHDSALRCDRT